VESQQQLLLPSPTNGDGNNTPTFGAIIPNISLALITSSLLISKCRHDARFNNASYSINVSFVTGGGDDDDDDDRELVYARRSRRRGREEGAYNDVDTSSSGSRKYQDNVEFFDLDDDDDDMFEDDFDRKSNDDPYEETYNGIIPNPLLDAMDPDGVYERLGPELFKDWTFWRDMILFAAFLAFFTRDTHHYGTFDSVVEGMERLPANFIR